MYFLSLLCVLWSGSMEIGDFIWQFYISPPIRPLSYAYLDFNNTIFLQTQEQIYSSNFYWCCVLFGVSMVSALFAPINFTSKFLHFSRTLQFPFERSWNLGVIFSFLSSILRWLWQDIKTPPIPYITMQQRLYNEKLCNSIQFRVAGGIQSDKTRT